MPNVVRKSGEYVYYDDGSVALQTHTDNAPDSNSMNPVDIQSRYAQTIQTQSGVTVAPTNGVNYSTWVDCDGFDKIGIVGRSDASHPWTISLDWSVDTTATHYSQSLATGTTTTKGGIADVCARYVRVALQNTDAAPHVISAWAYLKC